MGATRPQRPKTGEPRQLDYAGWITEMPKMVHYSAPSQPSWIRCDKDNRFSLTEVHPRSAEPQEIRGFLNQNPLSHD
jgi:hypothetical protein